MPLNVNYPSTLVSSRNSTYLGNQSSCTNGISFVLSNDTLHDGCPVANNDAKTVPIWNRSDPVLSLKSSVSNRRTISPLPQPHRCANSLNPSQPLGDGSNRSPFPHAQGSLQACELRGSKLWLKKCLHLWLDPVHTFWLNGIKTSHERQAWAFIQSRPEAPALPEVRSSTSGFSLLPNSFFLTSFYVHPLSSSFSSYDFHLTFKFMPTRE